MEEQLDAIEVNAVDTTAAGDAFNGAFAVGLLLGKTPVESARFAIAAAAPRSRGLAPSRPCRSSRKSKNCSDQAPECKESNQGMSNDSMKMMRKVPPFFSAHCSRSP